MREISVVTIYAAADGRSRPFVVAVALRRPSNRPTRAVVSREGWVLCRISCPHDNDDDEVLVVGSWVVGSLGCSVPLIASSRATYSLKTSSEKNVFGSENSGSHGMETIRPLFRRRSDVGVGYGLWRRKVGHGFVADGD